MLCSKEESLVRLFYNASCFFHLLLLFFYVSSILLAKIFHFLCSYPIIRGYNYYVKQEEEEEEEEEEEDYFYGESTEKDYLVAGIVCGGEALQFGNHNQAAEEITSNYKDEEHECYATEELFVYDSLVISEYSESESEHDIDDDDDAEAVEEEILTTDYSTDTTYNSPTNEGTPWPTSPIALEANKTSSLNHDDDHSCDHEVLDDNTDDQKVDQGTNAIYISRREERFLVFEPTARLESRKLLVQETDQNQKLEKDDPQGQDKEIFVGSCTVGSTSKSSSEWRSSINCRDSTSGTDPFSSSSTRSCRKWMSYTVFQKYDEDMMFLDRISAQKLHETESLRSFQANPRSISERIIHKIATINKNKRPASDIPHNPYHELEAAYVAQICLTWEALNCNYTNFQRKRLSICRGDLGPGCPGHIAQQFQQFQVILQRYIENEPYEHGRRPEIYARMRLLAPKLLFVPEYQDSNEDDDDQNNEGFGSKVSSASFLMIMEDGIRMFMNFLKADTERPCQIVTSFFKGNRRGSVNRILLSQMKKVKSKKKMKLKDIRRAGKCIRRKRLKIEDEMEIMLGLIDLKVVSRVLRMNDISEEQLQWCQEKMSKVRVWERKVQRDSTPLFFPHTETHHMFGD